MNTVKTIKFLAITILFLGLNSCSDDDNDSNSTDLEVKTIVDLNAQADVRDPQTGQITLVNPYKYIDLSTGTEVAITEDWDVAFKGSSVIVNGTDGALASVVSGTFDEIIVAPEDSEFSDSIVGLGGLYTYNPTTHYITINAGNIIVIKTQDEKYAKLELLKYNSDTDNLSLMNEGIITFQYVYQADGTKEF